MENKSLTCHTTSERRLIDANALLELVQYRLPIDNHTGEVVAGCVNITRRLIENAPTVDAVPVVHGRWMQARYTEAPLYICSNCDKPEYKTHNYCPNCGALMDGGNEDG